MLFWIFVILLVIGIVVNILDTWDDLVFVRATAIIIGTIGVVISVIILICSYANVDGKIAANQARYDMLVYQYENDIYDNDIDLGKRALLKDIQDWNEDLARYQGAQDDFWIGIYYPNVFDQFEFIELDKAVVLV